MGAAPQNSTRLDARNAAHQDRIQPRLGGQYALGLFGLPGFAGGPAPRAQAPVALTAPARYVAPCAKLPATRVRGALSPASPDGIEGWLAREERAEIEAEEARARAARTAVMDRAARESRHREEREWLAAARAEEEASYSDFLAHWFPHVQGLMERGEA